MAFICLASALTSGGCVDNHAESQTQQPSQVEPQLAAASSALSNHQPDATIAYAESALKLQPYGPAAAQAWYLEGRGYEEKTASGPTDMQRNLSQARSCYLQALQQNPPKAREGDIHASLSNVAFFQDDYSEAIREASAGLAITSVPQIKGYLLLRTGESQQRLSEFSEADQTFRQVQQRYPNTPFAEAAREHEGQRNFYVQLATFESQDAATHATQSLHSGGVVVSLRTDDKGHTIVDAGPYTTFTDAKRLRDQMRGEFPSAIIVP